MTRLNHEVLNKKRRGNSFEFSEIQYDEPMNIQDRLEEIGMASEEIVFPSHKMLNKFNHMKRILESIHGAKFRSKTQRIQRAMIKELSELNDCCWIELSLRGYINSSVYRQVSRALDSYRHLL